MKTIKKLTALILALVLCLSFAACGGGGKKSIDPEVIKQAVSSYKYTVGGMFSSTLGELLPQASPDYKMSYATYEGKKAEILDEDSIANLESGDYSEHLSNAYFVTITGSVRENPDIPTLMSAEKEILKLLFIFDKDDALVQSYKLSECREFNTFAIITLASY